MREFCTKWWKRIATVDMLFIGVLTLLASLFASWLKQFPGFSLFGALIIALLNMTIKPILQLFGLPITVITLGIFYIIINTALLYLASWLANGLFGIDFIIATFGSGFVASIVISIVSSIMNGLLGADSYR